MSGPWEDYAAPSDGPWSDYATKPAPIGKAAMGDFLKQELANTDWGTRNIAGFGTALSDIYEGAKQAIGLGDSQRIKENKVIAEAAPVGAIAGNVAMTAIPFGMAGNGINAAAKVGTVMGALAPVDSENAKDIVAGKILGAATGGVTAAAGQAVANKAGEYVANKLQALAALKAQKAPIDKTLQDALDAGFVVPPSSVNPSAMNQIVEGMGGKVATAQTASNRNADVADALARKLMGLGDNEPLTSEAMQAIRDRAYQTGYAPLEKAAQAYASPDYAKGLDAILANRASAARTFPGANSPDLQSLIEGYKPANGVIDVGDALKATQLLRREATAAYRVGNNEVGSVKRAISDQIESEIERQLSSQGNNGADMLDRFRAARKLMAQSHDIEDAIVEGGGTLDARKIAAKYQRDPSKLSDELAVIGAFAKNFPKAMQPRAQVAGPAVSKLDLALAAAGAATGGATGGGEGSLLGAAAPMLASRGARAYLLSGRSQNALRDLYKLGLPTRTAAGMLQYAPVGGAVLGRNALAEYLAP